MTFKRTGSIAGLVIGIAIVVTVALAIWKKEIQTLSNASDLADPGVGSERVEARQVPPVKESPEAGNEPKKPAKRIVEVPSQVLSASNPVDEILAEVDGNNAFEMATEQFERALDGSLDAALAHNKFRNTCTTMYFFNDLETWLSNAVTSVEYYEKSGRPVPPHGMETFDLLRIFPTEKQNRQHWLEWFRACEKLLSFWSDDLFEEIEALAAQGNVIARYLYVTWPRTEIPEIDSEYLEFRRKWEINSIEFSHANVRQGEIAGLLALGESYRYGWFTPKEELLAVTYLRAALECGYVDELSRPYVENKIKSWTENLEPNQYILKAIHDSLLLSEQLAAACR